MPLKLPSRPKILIVRFSSLGDVVLSLGVAPALKSHYPEATIVFLTKKPYDELLALAPGVDRIITLEKGESVRALAGRLVPMGFDLIVDLHGNLRSRILCFFLAKVPHVRSANERWKRMALVWFKQRWGRGIRPAVERYAAALRQIDPVLEPEAPRLELEGAASLQKKLGLNQLKDPVIGLCVSSQHATKRWNQRSAAEFINRWLSSTKGGVLLIGARGEADTALPASPSVLDLSGKTSLEELAAALARCSALVTVDSGPMHIAEALGVPVVSLFGPTVADFGFAPRDRRSRIIELPLACRPCSLHGSSTCPLGHHRCMNEISPERVAAETLALTAWKH